MRVRDANHRNFHNGDCTMINPWRLTLCLLLAACSVSNSFAEIKQREIKRDLLFRVKPVTPVFYTGADVILEFQLKNVSARKVLASRAASLHDLIYIEVIDEHGRRVSWQGKIPSRGYPVDFFVVLNPGQSITFRAVISFSNGAGYDIHKPGTYRVKSTFSLAPKEYFAQVSNGAVIPERPVRSNWAHFSVITKRLEQVGESK